ncbi:MAG: hypothetical protein Q9162_003367 [Coniocarpon cinnabarinum]
MAGVGSPGLTLRSSGAVVGWTGLVRVDNDVYTWMGAPNVTGVIPPVVNQTSYSYTSTRSIFQMDVAGKVDMNITFLSAVYPQDYMRQSFPISFLDVSVESKDGLDHSVQVYTDISAGKDFGLIGASPAESSQTSGSSASSTADASTTAGSSSTSASASDSSTLSSTTAAAQRRRLEADVDARDAPEHHYQTYGTRKNFDIIDYETHYRHPFVPTTSNYVNPIPAASPTTLAPASPSFAQPAASETGGIAFHKVYRQTQLAFSEVGDQTEYGYWYYATDNSEQLTYQQGPDNSVREVFLCNGYLNNSLDTAFRAINDSYPVFGFAYDFGNVTTPQNHLWAIALAQEQAVQFDGAQGNQTVNSLWTETYANDTDAYGQAANLDQLQFYFNDYPTAVSASDALDAQVASDSTANGGSNYTLLTTLAVRQAFGALEYTNTSESPLIFLKEISSDGNVNTVDVIFPFHPISIYLNPDILKNLLDPLFINQENFHWPFQYSIHDIGSRFPNATGHDDGMAEMQPLEECGNMIIMTLAYAQRANDTAYLQQHYDILRQWNDYLVNDSLIPQNQISTDDFAGALENQTNLAVKGIIGIEAMAAIANLTGNFDDGANFTNIAHSYISQWQTLAAAAGANPPHTTLNYGNDTTYSLLYNVFSDKELGLGLVPQEIFDQQSAFYPTVLDQYPYGAPLDTRGNYTKNDWEIFCASVASAETKAQFINEIAQWVSETPTNLPLTDLYYCESGDYPTVNNSTIFFATRPTVGGYFAPLALDSAPAAPVSIPGPADGAVTRRWDS